MVLKRPASNVFKPKDRVLKKKTVLYETSRTLQSINAAVVLEMTVGHRTLSDQISKFFWPILNWGRSCFPWRSCSAIRFASNHIQMYRIYPHIGRTFFKEKTFEIWGAALRGYKSFELINMQNFPTHTESTKLLNAWQFDWMYRMRSS